MALEMAMGFGLFAGAQLARRGLFRLHACCQSTVVIANLVLIALTMAPAFGSHIIPVLARPAKLAKSQYALAVAHATLGSIAELGGLYILLSAGTDLLPRRFRITRYKVWMRSLLALWWVVLLLGLATYARWYVPHLH